MWYKFTFAVWHEQNLNLSNNQLRTWTEGARWHSLIPSFGPKFSLNPNGYLGILHPGHFVNPNSKQFALKH